MTHLSYYKYNVKISCLFIYFCRNSFLRIYSLSLFNILQVLKKEICQAYLFLFIYCCILSIISRQQYKYCSINQLSVVFLFSQFWCSRGVPSVLWHLYPVYGLGQLFWRSERETLIQFIDKQCHGSRLQADHRL